MAPPRPGAHARLRALSAMAGYALRFPGKTVANLRRPAFVANSVREALGVRRRTPDLIRLVLFATARCNARCLMCDVGQGAPGGLNGAVRRQQRPFLEPDLLRRLLDDPLLRRRRLTVSLLMTEPLLHPRIDDIVRMIAERGHHVDLVTNGLLLAERAAALASAGIDTIHVSLDGPAEVHDRIRGVPGAFRRAVAGIRAVNRLGPVPVAVTCTISAANQHALPELVTALEREGLAIDLLKFQFQFFVSAPMAVASGEQQAGWTSSIYPEVDPGSVDPAALAETLRGIRRRGCAAARRLAIFPDVSSAREIADYFSSAGAPLPGNSTCLIPWQQLALTTDGEALVHMRCFDYRVGSFPGEDLSALFNGERMRRFRETLRAADYCLPGCTRCACALAPPVIRPATPSARA